MDFLAGRDILDRVNQLATNEGQLLIAKKIRMSGDQVKPWTMAMDKN